MTQKLIDSDSSQSFKAVSSVSTYYVEEANVGGGAGRHNKTLLSKIHAEINMMLNTIKVLFKDGKMACYTLNTSSCGSSKILQESMRKKKGKFDAFRAAW